MVMAASVAGFAAGLLGVGGGLVMVPALYYAFTVLDFEMATKMHLALGTSLAIIIPTSIMSTKTHMKFNAVDFGLIKSFGIYIIFVFLLSLFLSYYAQEEPRKKGQKEPSLGQSQAGKATQDDRQGTHEHEDRPSLQRLQPHAE